MPATPRRCTGPCGKIKIDTILRVTGRVPSQDHGYICRDCLELAGQMKLRTERLEADGDSRHYE